MKPAKGRSPRERAQKGEFAQIEPSGDFFDVTLDTLPNMSAREIDQLRGFLETHGFPYHAESIDILQGRMGIRQ